MDRLTLLETLSIQQLDALKTKGISEDRIIYVTSVDDISLEEIDATDTPSYYIVVKNDYAINGLVVYGWSLRDGEWVANPRTRWLIGHFIEVINQLKKDLQNGIS
jgi:hypothetical protein